MKRMGILIALVYVLMGVCVFAESPIKVTINGTNLEMKEPPVIINGRTLVPLRAIFEALGVTPTWDSATQTVTAASETVRMSLTISDSIATVNDRKIQLDAPGTLINGSTMVPARFIAETFGATANWDPDTKTVDIKSLEPKEMVPEQVEKLYPNGDKYQGSFINGMKEGEGTFTFSDGSLYDVNIAFAGMNVYVGEFSSDKMNGHGVLTLRDGRKYEGEFKDDQMEGRGKMVYPDGTKYIGDYVDGKRNGQGSHTDKQGNTYIGPWKNGLNVGPGKVIFAEGGVYEGEFKDGFMNGNGVYTDENGAVYNTTWENGRMMTRDLVSQ